MKILVCGGRHYADKAAVFAALDKMHAIRPIELLVHGACPVGHGGADMLADAWGWSRSIDVRPCPINHWLDGDWPTCGRHRNERMWATCREWINHGVEFPGGFGTKHMAGLMRAAGIEVWQPIVMPN